MSVSVTLQASSRHRLVLSHYAPDEKCRPHRHDRAQISMLLAGGYVEDSDHGRALAEGPSLSRKPGGFEHQNLFGAAGALILSLNVDPTTALARYSVVPRPEGVFGPDARLSAGAVVLAGLAEGFPAGPLPPASTPLPPASTPRPWLTEAHDRLLAESGLGIGALARTFGVHPVRFSRLFREAFARSPSAIRQNHRTARAVCQLVQTATPLAEIAVAEGFSDQPHLSREVGQATGWSPARLRRLFAGV